MTKPDCTSGVFICTWLLAAILGGCAVERGKVYVVDDQRYCVVSGIWQNKWWQHYERGLSCAQGKFWDEAVASFQAALAAGRGQKDRWRVNTYGVHVLEDYFPHRELGIAYFRLKQYVQAQRELETSYRMVKTSKAAFYLNETRRILLQQTQGDTASPRIILDHPSDGLLTHHLRIDVRGRAEDDTSIKALSINRHPLFVELAEPRLPFTHDMVLHDGANAIDLVAVDLLGRKTHRRVTVHLDRYGPLVSLGRVELAGTPPHQRVLVQGMVSDRHRIARFELAGRPVRLQPGTASVFRQDMPIQLGATSLPFEAEDAAGNMTRGEIALTTAAGGRTRTGRSTLDGLPQWAFLPSPTVVSDLPAIPSQPVSIAMSQGRERVKPVIKLFRRGGRYAREAVRCSEHEARDQVTVYNDAIYLQVHITDDSPIVEFSIQNQPLLKTPESKGRELFLAYTTRLRLRGVGSLPSPGR